MSDNRKPAPHNHGLLIRATFLVISTQGVSHAQSATREYDCLIRPETTVLVSAPIAGAVAEMYVERGDFVEANQPLAMMEYSLEEVAGAIARNRAAAQSELKSAQARLDYQSQRLARAKKLQADRNFSDQNVEDIQNELHLAEAALLQAKENSDLAALELDRAEAALERRRIRSPVKGVVMRRILNPGEYADPPQILEIAQIDPLRIDVLIPAAEIGNISKGQHAKVRPEVERLGVQTAEVTVVDPVVDAASGSFGIRLTLPNPDHAIPAGLKCTITF